MYPQPILDLLSRPSYWDRVADHESAEYSPYVAALSALVSFGAYSEQPRLLQNLLEQRLGFSGPDSGIEVHQVSVTAPALFVDTNMFVVKIPKDRAKPHHEHIAIVAFRGTEFVGPNFLTDVFTDVTTVPVAFPLKSAAVSRGEPAWVHSGFLTAAEFIWSDVINTLVSGSHDQACQGAVDTLCSAERFYMTGHSLGGAVAMLVAARLFEPPAGSAALLREKLPISRFGGLYTFGQPMVGNEAFRAHFETPARSSVTQLLIRLVPSAVRRFVTKAGVQQDPQRTLGELTFRHVHAHDWVPHVPPWTTGLYVHLGDEWRAPLHRPFGREKSPKRTTRVWFAVSVSLALAPALLRPLRVLNELPFIYSIEDHLPEFYLRAAELTIDELERSQAGAEGIRAA